MIIRRRKFFTGLCAALIAGPALAQYPLTAGPVPYVSTPSSSPVEAANLAINNVNKYLQGQYGGVAIVNPTFTGTLTGPTYAGDVSNTSVVPTLGSSANALSAITNRIISLDDAAGIHADGVTDDTGAIQALLNSVALANGGTVLVGPHRYAIGSSVAGLQPTQAFFNTSGFTIIVPNASTYYTVGNSYTLSGFTSPLAQLNGTWTVNSIQYGNNVVFLTSLTGTQLPTTTGLGTVVQNLIVPSGVALKCAKPLMGSLPPGGSYATLPYSLVVQPGATISAAQSSSIDGCNVLSSIATTSNSTATLRQFLNQANAFTGTGITLTGSDVNVKDAFIGGFQTGIYSSHTARLHLHDVKIDANVCVYTTQSHDIAQFEHVECGVFLSADSASSMAAYTISNIANNGSGLWRVTLSSAGVVQTGDTVYVSYPTGANSAYGAWTATVINSTTVDLQGSTATGQSLTANTTSGAPCVTNVSTTAGMGIGSNITGTGIPASTTIQKIYPRANTICLSAAATATGTGISLSVSDNAYTASSATLYLDSQQRPGSAFYWDNSETLSCTDCMAGNHLVGYEVGPNAAWISLVNSNVDNIIVEDIPNSIGLYVHGGAVGTTMVAGSINSAQTAVAVNVSGNASPSGVMVNGVTLNTILKGTAVELDNGKLIVSGSNNASAGDIFSADAANSLILSGDDLNPPHIWTQTNTGAAKIFNGGNGIIPALTVATLPTCNAAAADQRAVVTDASSPTYNAALTGGGSSRVPVVCDGSTWKAH